jgi:hypothetical protein
MTKTEAASPTNGDLDGRCTAPKQAELSTHFPGGIHAESRLFDHSKFLRKHYGHEDKISGGETADVKVPGEDNQSGDEWVRKEKAEVEESRRKQQEKLDQQYQAERKHRQDVDKRDTEARLEELKREVMPGV